MTKAKKPTKLDEQAALEAKVDAMMDPNAVKPAAELESAPATEAAMPALDIFAGTEAPINEVMPGAPTLPGKTAKKVEPVTEPAIEPAPPVVELELSQPVTDTPVTDDVVVKPLQIDTPKTDQAIDDIVAQEADQVLAAQDAGLQLAAAEAEATAPKEPTKHGHPIFWFIVVLLIIIAAFTAYVLVSPDAKLPFGA